MLGLRTQEPAQEERVPERCARLKRVPLQAHGRNEGIEIASKWRAAGRDGWRTRTWSSPGSASTAGSPSLQLPIWQAVGLST